ncbi:MAG: protein kinase [Actinomycetota bacterium]|nr:protein kinase [Actinomycetota bacterium]
MIKFADRFVLENELGSGGMARVFLGRDEVLDRPVAVKLLNPIHGGTEIGDRFRREGRTAARLAHPNIVQVYDAGEAEFNGRETSYIVMEYVPGGDLKGLIDWRGRLPGAELARLGDEICAGLAHAHERGVIHRDIKPHNILLDENGHAKVTDFGIARALDATQATRTGAYLGTALYSSPEQLRGQRATPKSDIYSLGATLYQAATGEPPFSGGTPLEIASQHVSRTPIPCRERGAGVGEDLEALILACLAKNPEDRPTAEEMRSRLDAEIRTAAATQAQRTITVAAPARTEQTRAAPLPGGRLAGAGGRPKRRRGLLAAFALLAVLVVIGALAVPDLFKGDVGSNSGGQNNAQAGGNAGGSEERAAGGSGSDQGPQGSGRGQQGAGQSASAPSQSIPEKGEFTAEAAEQTVEAFYTMTSEGDYDRSARLLSEDWRRSTFPNRAVFEGTFDKVESVVFIQGPHAEISGNAATVTGETQATLTTEIQHNEGTWYLIQEDGRWKIDGWDVIELSSRPA